MEASKMDSSTLNGDDVLLLIQMRKIRNNADGTIVYYDMQQFCA